MQNGQRVQWTGRAHPVVVFTVKVAMVSLYNRKQSFVALSTAEAKYIVLSVAVCEAM
jgi:hypothetical protein